MIESIKKNKKGILLMLISSICACLGQLFWKIGTDKGLLYIFIGFVLYGLGAILMTISYRYGELSILQPIMSCNYVFSTILGVLILKEVVGINKIIGIIVIIIGVLFIVGGDDK